MNKKCRTILLPFENINISMSGICMNYYTIYSFPQVFILIPSVAFGYFQ